MKLNIGGIKGEKEGFKIVGLDRFADIKCDLNNYPYEIESDSIDEIYASHIIEHLKEPFDFMEEMYRIMKFGARIIISVPYWNTKGAMGTFEHSWHVNELAVNDFTGARKSSIFPYQFKHISTKVIRGRFLLWQKRQIIWELEK